MAATASGVYALGLAMSTVAFPLTALHAGYSGTDVGLLVGLSAAAQLTSRLFLARVMRVLADRTLVVGAGGFLAVSDLAIVLSHQLAPFLAAALLQGVSRACFWTGLQTHVLRQAGSEGRRDLARVNLFSGIGLVAGPSLSGALGEISLSLSLAVAAAIALASCGPALMLRRMPVFVPPADRPPGRLWRRPGVDSGCWAGVTAGAWRALLSSYVPVALTAAGAGTSTVGILVSCADTGSIAGSAAAGRVRDGQLRRAYVASTLGAAAGIAVVVPAAGVPVLAAVFLAVSGLGAGVLQTLGPAMATQSVAPGERAEAVAVAGTFRAAALMVAPVGVAGLVLVAPLGVAMALAGALMVLPSLTARRPLPAQL
jgi:MFS family permease